LSTQRKAVNAFIQKGYVAVLNQGQNQ